MGLATSFDHKKIDPALRWHFEPNTWQLDGKRLSIRPDGKTDFWQRTHYGFQVDNGHFLFASVKGDFMMETEVQCHFQHQYDQAGLMVRVSDQCWVKTSVEFEPKESNKLGAVVTNHGYSDWSTQDVRDNFTNYKLRITRSTSDYTIHFYDEAVNNWIQLRMFHLHDQQVVKAGLYCCSPKDAGFEVSFSYLNIYQ